jgi:hypothetical protein
MALEGQALGPYFAENVDRDLGSACIHAQDGQADAPPAGARMANAFRKPVSSWLAFWPWAVPTRA